MNRVRDLLYVIFFFAVLCGTSSGSDDEEPKKSDGASGKQGIHEPARTESAGNDRASFTAAASLDYDLQGIELGELSFGNRGISYLRDRTLHAGVRIAFSGAGLDARIGIFDENIPDRRKVSDFTVRGSYFSRVFGAEVCYQRAGRYRIMRSPFGTGKVWNEARQGFHMNSESAGLNLFLFMKDLTSLNRDFSYCAAFDQSGSLERSVGSFMIIAGANYQRMRAPLPIIPADTQALFLYRKLWGLTGWRRTGFSIGIGFAGALALPRSFFIAPMIGLTINPCQMEYLTAVGTKRAFRFDSLRGMGRIRAGYNGDRFFTGLYVNFESFINPSYRFKAELWTGDLAVGFFSGFRI